VEKRGSVDLLVLCRVLGLTKGNEMSNTASYAAPAVVVDNKDDLPKLVH
jgi:hypothetical protein